MFENYVYLGCQKQIAHANAERDLKVREPILVIHRSYKTGRWSRLYFI